MTQRLLDVKNLTTAYHTFKGTVQAVNNVSFHLDEGEILAIVGESGGGKSVTGFSIIGLIDEPGRIESGEILFNGQDLRNLSERQMNELRGRDISMIFQDPMTSLNPVYTIGQQIDETLKLHTSLNTAERRDLAIELLSAVGIPEGESRLKNYPHQFSGGMRQRVVIAIALAASPRLVIADEPTTALDVTIQAQILHLMADLVHTRNCALMLITHDLAVVSETADRVNVMYCGRIVESGCTRDVIDRSSHPYTKGLINSIPDLDRSRPRLETIPGIVPNMYHLPPGCAFAPRCAYAKKICHTTLPELSNIGPKHQTACHYPLLQGGGLS